MRPSLDRQLQLNALAKGRDYPLLPPVSYGGIVPKAARLRNGRKPRSAHKMASRHAKPTLPYAAGTSNEWS